MNRETVEWRGQRWFVADERYDEVPSDTGSHWHLTLVLDSEEGPCVACGGHGYTLVSNDPDPGQSQMRCYVCRGTGKTREVAQ